MPKPKFVKPLLIGVACTIPVGLVVGLSVNWDHTQFISAVGSSGVKPFIESFGKAYHNSHKKFDVTVESGGTMFAVEQIAKGFTTIGNASNNPYLVVNTQGYKDQWTNKKTLTLGWEGLVMMYSLPKGLTQETIDKFDITISTTNILDLYGVFSGYHEYPNGTKWPKNTLKDTLWHYAPLQVRESITNENDQKILQQTKILPFVRAGGNSGANSSIAFSYYSNLREFDEMSQHQQQAFKYGKYGSDGLTLMQTDESNARAWQSFVYNDKGASMTYLTSSFLANENNRKEIKKNGYKIAQYQPISRTTPIIEYPAVSLDGTQETLSTICSKRGYNWYRPINVMIDLSVQKAKDFIYWMYLNTDKEISGDDFHGISKEFSDTMYAKGAKPITSVQFKTMWSNNLADPNPSLKQLLFDLSANDLSLAEDRTYGYEKVYGAEDTWEV